MIKFTYKKYKRVLLNQPIRNYLDVFNDDVFLVSYPRSGNTWLRFLLGSLIYKQQIDWNNFEQYVPDIYRNSNKELKRISRPRILKSHHSYDSRYNKVIYLVRDVRDVLVSYYKFHLKFKKIKKDYPLDTFIENFINGELDDFGTWKQNVESWLKNKDEIKYGFLLIRYEDLLQNTYSVVQKIMDFLGYQRTDKEISNAIEWASFSNMRKLEDNQKNADIFEKSESNLKFTNKGTYGYWKDFLNQANLQILESYNKDLLVKLDYEIYTK